MKFLPNSELSNVNGGGGYYPTYNQEREIAVPFSQGVVIGWVIGTWNELVEFAGR